MDYKQEHKELAENILKKSPGFRGNEDLLEEMLNETLKKSRNFLDCSMDAGSLEIYIKKIAGNVIVDILKNADNIRAEKEKKAQAGKEFREVPISYETDEKGKIIYRIKVPEINTQKGKGISKEKIKNIKEKVIELHNKSSQKNYKQIFELRFIKELSHQEIAKKLDVKEEQIASALFEMLNEFDSV